MGRLKSTLLSISLLGGLGLLDRGHRPRPALTDEDIAFRRKFQSERSWPASQKKREKQARKANRKRK